MSEPEAAAKQGDYEELNIQDYLDATSEAAHRARTVIIVIVVASVLAFVGFMNSIWSNWMLRRVQTLALAGATTRSFDIPRDAANRREIVRAIGYRESKLGHVPDPANAVALEAYARNYEKLYSAMLESYVDNALSVHVPFFGVIFDINHLGIMSGLAFSIALFLYWLSCARERENMKWSFIEAEDGGTERLRLFYHLLAMRQVFATPRMESDNPVKLRSATPKLIPFLPLIVHAVVVGHDSITRDVGFSLAPLHARLVLTADWLLLALCGWLSFTCFQALRSMDTIWATYWEKVKPPE